MLRKLAKLFRRLVEKYSDTYAPLRVEAEKREYKSERPKRYSHLNTTPDPKKTKISRQKAKAAPVHTSDRTDWTKHSFEDTPTESAVQKGEDPRVDAHNTSTNVPRESLRVKSIPQQNDATPTIPEKESRQQWKAPNVITLEKTREGSARARVPPMYKARVLETLLATNAEPK